MIIMTMMIMSITAPPAAPPAIAAVLLDAGAGVPLFLELTVLDPDGWDEVSVASGCAVGFDGGLVVGLGTVVVARGGV